MLLGRPTQYISGVKIHSNKQPYVYASALHSTGISPLQNIMKTKLFVTFSFFNYFYCWTWTLDIGYSSEQHIFPLMIIR